MINVGKLRQDFPILAQNVNEEPLVYLDNAATTQMPDPILQTMETYYHKDHANVHRGVHTLAQRATEKYETAREKVRQFIHANEIAEVLFTKGTTSSLNWLARSFGDRFINEGDEIVLSYMEHHSNIVPWQQLAKRKKAVLKYISLTEDGFLDMEDARRQITEKTAIVAIAHASNVLGVINPIAELTELVHKHQGVIVVDGAQAVPNMPVNVKELDVDFYAFSGHKMLGPTGIGVLYGKRYWLEQMEPVEFGGEMIDFVYLQESTWAELPWKFEAGTPNIAGGIGLGSAIGYLNEISLEEVYHHEKELIHYVLPRLAAIEGLTVYGPSEPVDHTGVIAFNLDGLHPHDLATALDMQGVAVRAGHHCAQPLLNYLDTMATARASFYLYNTKDDADRLIEAIKEAKEFFRHGSF